MPAGKSQHSKESPRAAKLSPVRVNPLFLHPSEKRMNLSDGWRFRLDPADEGIKKSWFRRPDTIKRSIKVPGCWQGQGFGGDADDEVWDFRLKARTFRATYKGTGWYAKSFAIPETWSGRRLWLNFGGAHPSAEAWLNGKYLGCNDLPFVPFAFEISGIVRSGSGNDLVVRIHERNREFGFAYNWQGSWSGLYRGVEITSVGECFLERLSLYPDVDRQELRISARIGGSARNKLMLRLAVHPGTGKAVNPIAVERPVIGADINFRLPVSSPLLWSPDTPNLYRVEAELCGQEGALDAQIERTGFVTLAARGNNFLVNGEPYYIRGTGDFLSCPETGCPDTSRERWRRKLRALREYGYNQVRCQSYVYAPEYFDVADEMGLLIQSEMGMLGAWAGMSPWHVYPWPQPMASNRETLRGQWNKIVLRDVNHPSANIYCMSNELGGRTFYPRTAWQCYRETKEIKPTAMVIWTDGGHNGELPEDFVNAEANTKLSRPKPLIQHEFRWWSSFPDVRIRKKYSGAIRPYCIDIALDAAGRHGLAHRLPDFADRSQRLQLLEAKAKMENCRRDNPTLAGISHFNAMDANPSPQGIIDEFYCRKIADAKTWLETNGDTVVLSSLAFEDRVLTGGAHFKCKFFVSDFSHPPMKKPSLGWRLNCAGKIISRGESAFAHKPYRTHPIGEIRIELPPVAYPKAARLEVSLLEAHRIVTNSWNLWIFPEATLPRNVMRYGRPEQGWLHDWKDVPLITAAGLPPCKTSVVLSDKLDDHLTEFMRGGGRVILAAGEGMVRPHGGNGCGGQGYFFTPGANYAPYEDGQNGTVIRKHPMLGDFPHEGFADLQFYRLMNDAPPIELEPFGLANGEPAIRVIHRYPVCHPLGYLLERSFGKGGVILTSLDLSPRFPEARYLLSKMCAYAMGGQFKPGLALSDAAVSHMIQATA